nr:hypothetical protein [Rhodopseudomonas rhenobacensis]
MSVRQPWAWAIAAGFKPLENRSAAMIKHLHPLKGRRAIHASKGMTRDYYEQARAFMASISIECPAPADLLRGGIIGSVDVVDVVSKSGSPWFFGPRALVLQNAQPCDFIPSVGALGYFEWRPADPSIVPPPARWMLAGHHSIGDDVPARSDLFGDAP